MDKDVIYNKCSIVERCFGRIKEEYNQTPANLHNFTKQDSIILNIQRACEACIDLAMHVVAQKQLGIPQHSREAFDLLGQHGYIPQEQVKRMRTMVGFRNIAVHNYQAVNLLIVQKIIEENLVDLENFCQTMIKLFE